MNGKQKYMKFLECTENSIPDSHAIIEAVKNGFHICFESDECEKGDDPEPNYKVSLYPGKGPTLTPFFVNADNEEQALEKVATKLIDENKKAYFIDAEEYSKLFADELAENPDFESDQYLYVDGTREGAAYPIYINILASRIEKI